MRPTSLLAPMLTAAVLAMPAVAEMNMLGDLHIEAPMLRATPPNAPVASGFVTIVNTGEADDTLVAVTIAGGIAGQVQLHRMSMADGVMTMGRVEGGIPIPSGQIATLAPGGLHLMLMDLTQPLKPGEVHAVTLSFATAGDVTLDFPVLTLREIRAAGEAAGATDHDMSDDGDHDAMRQKHHGN